MKTPLRVFVNDGDRGFRHAPQLIEGTIDVHADRRRRRLQRRRPGGPRGLRCRRLRRGRRGWTRQSAATAAEQSGRTPPAIGSAGGRGPSRARAAAGPEVFRARRPPSQIGDVRRHRRGRRCRPVGRELRRLQRKQPLHGEQRSIHVVKGRIEGRDRPPRVVNPYIQAPAPTCTYDGRTSRLIPTSPPVSVRTDREVPVPARGSDGHARRTRRPGNPCTCRARSMLFILCGGLGESAQSSTSRL